MAAIRVRFDDMENMSHRLRIMQLQPEAYQSKRPIDNDDNSTAATATTSGSAGTIRRESRLSCARPPSSDQCCINAANDLAPGA
jgi:hypothetical protein